MVDLADRQLIHPEWVEPLRPVSDDLKKLRRWLRSHPDFLPGESRIFRAFQQPFSRVRVLIMGQEPYATPGYPVGLSFAVAPQARLPRSLRNIYRELADDLGVLSPEHGDLSGWCRQGVLLLNRVLTVSPGKPGSHRGRGWEKITDQAVRALAGRSAGPEAKDCPELKEYSETGSPALVALLWGSCAAEVEPLLEQAVAEERAAVFKSPHPSPLAAYRGFFGSRPFSRANNYLSSRGQQPINWAALPTRVAERK